MHDPGGMRWRAWHRPVQRCGGPSVAGFEMAAPARSLAFFANYCEPYNDMKDLGVLCDVHRFVELDADDSGIGDSGAGTDYGAFKLDSKVINKIVLFISPRQVVSATVALVAACGPSLDMTGAICDGDDGDDGSDAQGLLNCPRVTPKSAL